MFVPFVCPHDGSLLSHRLTLSPLAVSLWCAVFCVMMLSSNRWLTERESRGRKEEKMFRLPEKCVRCVSLSFLTVGEQMNDEASRTRHRLMLFRASNISKDLSTVLMLLRMLIIELRLSPSYTLAACWCLFCLHFFFFPNLMEGIALISSSRPKSPNKSKRWAKDRTERK